MRSCGVVIEAAAVPDILCREVTLPNGLPLSPVEIDGATLIELTDVAVCRGVALLKGLALTVPIALTLCRAVPLLNGLLLAPVEGDMAALTELTDVAV